LESKDFTKDSRSQIFIFLKILEAGWQNYNDIPLPTSPGSSSSSYHRSSLSQSPARPARCLGGQETGKTPTSPPRCSTGRLGRRHCSQPRPVLRRRSPPRPAGRAAPPWSASARVRAEGAGARTARRRPTSAKFSEDPGPLGRRRRGVDGSQRRPADAAPLHPTMAAAISTVFPSLQTQDSTDF